MDALSLLESNKTFMEEFEKLSPEDQSKVLEELKKKKKKNPPTSGAKKPDDNGFSL